MIIWLDFYGIQISLTGPESLLSKVSKDFSYFNAESTLEPDLDIMLEAIEPDYAIIPDKLAVSFYHPEFVLYKNKGIKYVDYHGEGVSIYDTSFQRLKVMSNNLDLLHEIAYLAVHSFAGEMLEKQNISRILLI